MGIQIDRPLMTCVIGASVGAVVFGALTVYGLWIVPDHHLAYVLVCVFGWAAGWFTSFLYAPLTSEEKTRTERIGRLIGAFFTGYLLAEIRPFIEAATGESAIYDTFVGVLFFASSFATTFLVTVVLRLYYELPELRAREKQAGGFVSDQRFKQEDADVIASEPKSDS